MINRAPPEGGICLKPAKNGYNGGEISLRLPCELKIRFLIPSDQMLIGDMIGRNATRDAQKLANDQDLIW